MKPTTLLWCATVVAACANVTTPTPDQEVRLRQARALLADDPARALDVAEDLLKSNSSLRDARLVAAEASMRLAQTGKSRAQLHWLDAATDFDEALDGVDDADHPLALQLLAECRYQLGDFDAAKAAAARAVAGYAAVDVPENRRGAAEAMMLAGRCDQHQFFAARQLEIDSGERDRHGNAKVAPYTQELATHAMEQFQKARRELPGEATTQMAMIHQALGQSAEAMRELERGIRETPEEELIHDAYRTWMCERGHVDEMVSAYARFARESPTTTILRWYQARAIYTRADKLRQDGNFAGALAAYTKADGIYGDYVAMVPAHADIANQWRALCMLSMARCELDQGALANAEKHLLAAGDASPAATAYPDGKPQLADSFGSHFTSTVFAIHQALAESGDDALTKVLGFNERVLQRWPDRWGFVCNSAALAARDLGVQKAGQGDNAAAKELWERSYRHYEKAVALSPDDARITNDCGLMLVYHLNRDLDHARELFDRAIALGKQQLAALPAGGDPRERERLEEAVGDALQNIAVLLKDHLQKPFAEYRSFCEESVKYFPYERREAATLLRNQGASAAGGRATDARLASAQGGAAETLAKHKADVDQKAKAEDYDGALAVLDSIAKECKDHAPFQLLKGELTLKLAAQAMAAGRRGVDLFFQDAVAALKRAVELDSNPAAPRQLLAEAQHQSGDSEGATATLTALLLHLQSQGGGKPEELLALHSLRANAASRAYKAKKNNAQQDDKELLTAARASFRLLEDKGKLDPAGRQLWSETEQWAGAGAEAVNVYLRPLAKSPDDGVLLDAALAVGFDQKQMPLVVAALAKRTDALGLFYLGEARFWLADAERQAGKNAEAQKTLDAAREAFTGSMQKNTTYRDSCEQRLARCLGKKGNIAFWSDDLANAETWLLEAVKSRPDQIEAKLGSEETTKSGLMRVADKHFKKHDLGKVEAIYRTASDAANSDTDLLNNSGLFARDYGNQLERDGKQKEAMAMYEQSYKAYRRAQQLDAANVRLRNDCALIAIYYLERDWDLSKQLLDSAIADGDKTLRDSPPDDANDKQQLEEAVGDCYENLALWHIKHDKDGAAAKAAAERSTKYHPGERRPGARRHLQAAERLLQGK